MSVTVRDATVEDARAIGEILVASWEAAYRGLLADDILDEDDVEQRIRVWEGRLRDAAYTAVLLAEDDDGPAGVAALRPDTDPATLELHVLYLVPRAFGTGTSDALLDRCEEIARDHGAERITLSVLDRNERARRFYERRGFVADGSAKGWNGGVAIGYVEAL